MGAKVLFVDDDELIRAVCARALRRAGYDVLTAANGRQALRIMKKGPADVLVTDIFMPEMDGIEVAVEMKRRWPNVPVVAISAGARVLGAATALRSAKVLGASYNLAKPFSDDELIAVVTHALAYGTEPSGAVA